MIINVNPRGLLITCNSYILKTGQQHHKAQGARRLLYDIDNIADHFPTGRAMDLDLNIQGAPNFRAPNEESLNVFGVCLLCLLCHGSLLTLSQVAQPTSTGLKSILTLLGCQPAFLRRPNRRGSAAANTPPLSLGDRRVSRTESPIRSTNLERFNSIDEREPQGKAIWFSTREETLVYWYAIFLGVTLLETNAL